MKFNNKLTFLIVCLMMILLMGTISANKINETIVSTTSNDDGSFDGLQNTINSLPDNSILNLDHNYIYTGSGSFNGITFNKTNFTIDGHGHVLNANSGSNIVRIFNTAGSKITLKNMVLRNANVKTNDGGAILNNGQLTIDNISFINNKAHYGAAIQNNGEQTTITNSNFTSNQASSCGGGINNNANNFNIYNSNFNGNTASSYGGAICNDHNSFTLGNSSFVNNTASKGGAIQNNHANNTKITDSLFHSNVASTLGGAIHNDESSANLTIDNSIFVKNDANKEGGAIYNWKGGNLTLSNSNFANNVAHSVDAQYTEGGGGALRNYYADGLNVSNSNFTGNHVYYWGGAIYNDYSNNFNIDHSTFFENQASANGASTNSEGGAIKNVKSDNGTITNSVFSNNQAKRSSSSSTPCYGGAIHNDQGNNLNIRYSTFINNQADWDYGSNAIYGNDGSCTANNNWWGDNTPNWNKLTYGKVTHDNYGVLNLTATNKTVELKFYKSGTTNTLPISRNAIINIGNQSFTGAISDGTFKMDYTAPRGEYNITAIVDNQNISMAMYTTNVTLDVKDVNMYYHDGTHLIANLTNLNKSLANEKVYFVINNRTYNRTTDANGIAHIGINLKPNTYTARIYHNSSNIDFNVSTNATINVNTTLISQNILKTQQNGTQFYIKVLSTNGTPLNGHNVKFNINGVFYIRHTNATGVARLTINQNPGDYIVTVYNPVTNEQKGYNITI